MSGGAVAQKVLAAFDENPKMTSIELAALTGIHPSYVRTALTRNGRTLANSHSLKAPKPKRTTPVRKYRKLQDWEDQAILDALKGGEKLDAIAAEFGCDISTVSLIGKKNGLSRKPLPENKLVEYRRIGFSEALLDEVNKFAHGKRFGFGQAVRFLISSSLRGG